MSNKGVFYRVCATLLFGYLAGAAMMMVGRTSINKVYSIEDVSWLIYMIALCMFLGFMAGRESK